MTFRDWISTVTFHGEADIPKMNMAWLACERQSQEKIKELESKTVLLGAKEAATRMANVNLRDKIEELRDRIWELEQKLNELEKYKRIVDEMHHVRFKEDA